jgi:hypothetical protein
MPNADENTAKDMGRVISAADIIRERLGPCVLFVHHSGKAGAGPRGSTALPGAVDAQLQLEAVRDRITLKNQLQREAEAGACLSFVRTNAGESAVLNPVTGGVVRASHGLIQAEKDLIAVLTTMAARQGQGATAAQIHGATELDKIRQQAALRTARERDYVSWPDNPYAIRNPNYTYRITAGGLAFLEENDVTIPADFAA